jgi:hypothetical protein
MLAFECPPGKEVGFAAFSLSQKALILDYMQGKKGADLVSAKKRLGQEWYDAFMDRILQSYRPVRRELFMHMVVPEPNLVLPRKIRDRYFTKKQGFFGFALNHKKMRVRKSLGITPIRRPKRNHKKKKPTKIRRRK